jgi:TP901 family phage tail tape measure protein
MATIAQIVAVFQANTTGFQSGVSQVKQGIGDVQKSLGDLGAGMLRAGALITSSITAPIVAISEMGRSFETELRRVAANTAMTDAELEKMRDVVIDLGRNSAAPLADIAHGFEHAANFGFNAAESAKILDVALQGAVATGAKAEDVTNTLAGVMHQFGLGADQASVALNTLKEAAGKGNLTLEQMVQVSGKVFATAANLGLSLNEAAGAMSALTRAGFPAAQASTQLVGALTHLVNPSKEIRGELERLSKVSGVDLVHDFSQAGLQAKGFSGVLADVKKAVGDNTAEILKLFGGIRGGMGAMALAGNAADDYRKILEQLGETMSGKLTPIQDAYRRETETLGFQFGELKNRLTLLGDALNAAFSGSQVGFVKQLNDAVSALTAGFQSLDPAMQKAVATMLGAFAIGGPILVGAGALVTLLGGPLSLAIIGITALVATMAGEWAQRNSSIEGSTVSVKDGLLQMARVLGAVMDSIGYWGNLIFTLFGLIATAVNGLGTALVGILNLLTGGLIPTIRDSYNQWSQMTKTTAEFTKNAWNDAVADINGRWSQTLGGMVAQGYASASGFFGAGQKVGQAWAAGFASTAQFNAALSGAASTLKGLSISGTLFRKQALSDEEKQALSFAIDEAAKSIKDKKLPLPPMDLGDAKKKGRAAGKSLVDGFQDGVAGFDLAIKAIQANVSKLPLLLDPTTKQFRQQGTELERALSSVAKNINEFLSAAGINAKVTVANLTEHWQKFQAIISKTDAFEHLKDALNTLNLDRVAAGFAALDTSVKVNGDTIEISALAFQKLTRQFPNIATELAKVGLKVKEVFPAMKTGLEDTKDVVDDTGKSILHYGDIWLEAMVKANQAVLKHVPNLKQALHDLKDAVESVPLFDDAKVQNDAAQWVDSIIKVFEEQGARMGKTGESLSQFAIDGFRKSLEQLAIIKPEAAAKIKEVGDAQVEAYKKSLYQLPGVWNEVFNKLGSTAKSWASSVFGILDTIPGKFGSTVKKVTDTISQWANFFNSILGFLHKFDSSISDSLSGLIKSIVSSVRGAQAPAASAAQQLGSTIAAALGSAASGANAFANVVSGATVDVNKALLSNDAEFQSWASGAAGAATKAAGSFSTSAGSFLSSIGGIATAITGLAALYTSTFGSDSKIVRGVGGAASFGLIGALTSIFFGGPSAAEKEKRRLDNEKMKADLAASAQATINAAIEGFNKALEFFQKLDDFTAPRRKQFARFFDSMKLLMDDFVALAKEWGKDSLDKAKAFADSMGPIVQAVASGADAFEKLASLTAVPADAIDAFGAALKAIIKTLSRIVDEVGEEAIGAAKRLTKRIKDTVDLIGTGVQSFAALALFTGVSQSQARLFADGMRVAINELGKVIDSLEKDAMPNAKALARRAAEVVDLIGNGVTALTSLSTFGGIAQSTADLFRDALVSAIKAIIDAANQIDTDLLAAAQRFSDKAGSSVQLIGTAITSFKDLAGLKSVSSDVFAALGAMIKQAVSVLQQIASDIGDEGASAAAAFAAKAGPVVNTVKDAVAAFNALDSLQNVESGPFAALKIYIRRAVSDMGELAGELTDELVGKASAFGAKIKSVFEAIGSAVSVFSGLSNLSGGPDVAGGNFPDIGRALDFILNGVKAGVESLIKVSQEVSAEGIASAVDFANKAKVIFEAVTAGAASFKAIAEMPPITVSQWNQFFDNIALAIDTISRALVLVLQGLDMSVKFRDAATGTKDNIMAGLAALGAAADAFGGFAGGIPGSGPTGDTLSGSSFAPSSFAGSFAPSYAGASAGGDTVVNLHFHADVHTNEKFYQKVTAAVAKATRRRVLA